MLLLLCFQGARYTQEHVMLVCGLVNSDQLWKRGSLPGGAWRPSFYHEMVLVLLCVTLVTLLLEAWEQDNGHDSNGQ